MLTVSKEAENDILECFEYYQECRFGLGHDFLLCLEDGFSKIERMPKSYRKIYRNLRRVAINRFPYRIFYFVEEKNIIITAVFHAQKDPNPLLKRL